MNELKEENFIDFYEISNKLVKGELPYTVGGGIGQSRVAMFISKQEDIKSVQAIY